MSTGPVLSVLVCVKNGAQTIPDLLDSFARQTLRDFEVIIVDNGSSDDTTAVVRSFGYKPIESPGTLSDARRVAAAATRGPFLVMLDADQILADECLERCVQELEAGANAVVIPERAYRPANRFQKFVSYEREFSERYGLGVPRAFRRTRYEEVGGHCRDTLFGEDVAVRFKLSSAEVSIADGALVYHRELPSLAATLRKYFSYGRRARQQKDIVSDVITWNLSRFAKGVAAEMRVSPFRTVCLVCLKASKVAAIQAGRLVGWLDMR